MKVSRQQVQQNRQRILDAAASLFRERGPKAVSVVEVMQAAGLTHGAFYGHFDSKDALILEALAHRKFARWRKRADEGGIAGYIDAYLSPDHRDDPGSGCPVAGLSSAGAQASAQVRAALSATIEREIDRFSAAALGTAAQRRRKAIATYSAMVGAVVLARIADDKGLSQEILAATRKAIDLG
jgi:TetR/AcrR family transcriptional repressor of nem operon